MRSRAEADEIHPHLGRDRPGLSDPPDCLCRRAAPRSPRGRRTPQARSPSQSAERYAATRGIPVRERRHPHDSDARPLPPRLQPRDHFAREDFDEEVRKPLEASLVERGLVDRIEIIVTTKGVPLRIGGTGDPVKTLAARCHPILPRRGTQPALFRSHRFGRCFRFRQSLLRLQRIVPQLSPRSSRITASLHGGSIDGLPGRARSGDVDSPGCPGADRPRGGATRRVEIGSPGGG